MSKQFPVTIIDLGFTTSYHEGTLLDEILKSTDTGGPFFCNGLGSCGKCRVKVEGETSPPTLEEQNLLSETDFKAGIRLACQTRLMGPVRLEMPEKSGTNNILQTGLSKLNQLDPLWGVMTLSNPNRVSWESLTKELPINIEPNLSILRKIALLPSEIPEISIEYFGTKILDIDTANPNCHKYGVAVDIGTTTLAAYLVDLKYGRIVRTAATYNPQTQYGADLISRIQFADESGNLAKLHELVMKAINQLISELVSGSGIQSNDIIQVNFAGNTCMLHLLLQVSPVSLGRFPFEPVFKSMIRINPKELGLQINQYGSAFILPGIGGFVGSDISAGILACRLATDRVELLIDIGTNGEMVLTGQGRMLACSTAAGPAFEGAAISCGMLAENGAINDIEITKNEIRLKTIGHQTPKGICGTGLIRALAELLKAGYIEQTGRWAEAITHPHYDPDAKRFYLARENSIYISQSDIRQFQLAKSAIRTGIELLLKRLNITADRLERIYLAGAFGMYLKPEDAIYLGILPQISADKVQAVGNTAGMGTVVSILSQSAFQEIVTTVKCIEHIELAEEAGFSDIYTESMFF